MWGVERVALNLEPSRSPFENAVVVSPGQSRFMQGQMNWTLYDPIR